MEQVSPDDLLAAPLNRWAVSGCTLAWCHSPSLGGAACWGKPTDADARLGVRLLEFYQHPVIAPTFSIVLDASRIEGGDAGALDAYVSWARQHLVVLRERIRVHAGILPPGMPGFVLSGIMPLLGGGHPWRGFRDAREAYRFAANELGEAIGEEVRAHIDAIRGVAPELVALRQALRARHGDLSIGRVAREVGVSARSLQRLLASGGTSFREEQLSARFAAACELLVQTDRKIGTIAADLGVSERSLTSLFRARGEPPPIDYRKQRRG